LAVTPDGEPSPSHRTRAASSPTCRGSSCRGLRPVRRCSRSRSMRPPCWPTSQDSGALSERLARKGKGGAEELTELIDACFSSLLLHATAHGGDLLKFGGDALLLMFVGDDHVPRGCRSSASMPRALREFDESSAGTIHHA
jgi:hypothetical protein